MNRNRKFAGINKRSLVKVHRFVKYIFGEESHLAMLRDQRVHLMWKTRLCVLDLVKGHRHKAHAEQVPQPLNYLSGPGS